MIMVSNLNILQLFPEAVQGDSKMYSAYLSPQGMQTYLTVRVWGEYELLRQGLAR